jgi:hypothetical protein
MNFVSSFSKAETLRKIEKALDLHQQLELDSTGALLVISYLVTTSANGIEPSELIAPLRKVLES